MASANAYGLRQGDAILDKWALATSVADTLNALGVGWSGKCIVASADWRDQYDEARKLDDSVGATERKIDAITGLSALIATGGICQPVNVDYGIGTWATPARPLRDG